MAAAPLTTYKDLIDHLCDFLGANPTGEVQRDARRATLAALRALTQGAVWSYYTTRGRLYTRPAFSQGSVTYDAGTRTVTLTGGTWPDWTLYGGLQVNQYVYADVSAVPTPTTLVLAAACAPPYDLPLPTPYTLFQQLYPLPPDCLAIDRVLQEGLAFDLWFEPPAAWLERQRLWRGPAVPRVYTVLGHPRLQGALALGLYPAPDQTYTLDFIYRRQPRAILLDGYATGSASTVTGSTTITGSGTSWSPALVGSCVRLSGDAVTPPTGPVGPNFAALEAVILAAPDARTLTTDTPAPRTLGNAAYVISDIVDTEPGAMLNALYRCAEWQIGVARSRRDAGNLYGAYRQALIEARETDSRNLATEVSGTRRAYPLGLRYFPPGADVP